MALKCYLGTLRVAYVPVSGPGFDAIAYADGGVVFDNGVVVEHATSPGQALDPSQDWAKFVSTDTEATVRGKVQAAAVACFNRLGERSDGNTMTFVWLDDAGIL